MKSSNVIVRFMSLLDVALILLGVLMLALMQTTVTERDSKLAGDPVSPTNPLSAAGDSPVLEQISFVYLYAGWQGEQEGRCYVLNRQLQTAQEISLDSDVDIRALLGARTVRGGPTPVVMLLFDRVGWYPGWSEDRIRSLEKQWEIKIVPIYNFTFPS